jgi:hypothetical protein
MQALLFLVQEDTQSSGLRRFAIYPVTTYLGM